MQGISACAENLGCNVPATKMCGRCMMVRYCSVEHQAKDWPDHKTRCADLANQRHRAAILDQLAKILLGTIYLFAYKYGRSVTVQFKEPLEKIIAMNGNPHVAFFSANAPRDSNQEDGKLVYRFKFDDYEDKERSYDYSPLDESKLTSDLKCRLDSMSPEWYFMFNF